MSPALWSEMCPPVPPSDFWGKGRRHSHLKNQLKSGKSNKWWQQSVDKDRHRQTLTDKDRRRTRQDRQRTEARQKQDRTDKRQGTDRTSETDRKRETRDKACSHDDRDRERRSAWHVCGSLVRCVESETDQHPVATAPLQPNPTLTHFTPSKKKTRHLHDPTPRARRSPISRPKQAWQTNTAPNPTPLPPKRRIHRGTRGKNTETWNKKKCVMMMLTFAKVKERSDYGRQKSFKFPKTITGGHHFP